MNIPGIHFNNSNWPHIINALRIWSGTVMIGYPAVTFILDKLPISELMFLPIIIQARNMNECEWRKKVIYAEIRTAYEIHVRIENGLRGYGRKNS